MRITVQGKRAELTTGRDCEPNRWNAKAGRVTGTKEESKILNVYLDQLQALIYKAHQSLIKAGEMITADAIRNKYLGKAEKSHTLLEAVKDHNEKMKALVGKEFVQGTLNRYKVLERHLENFISSK